MLGKLSSCSLWAKEEGEDYCYISGGSREFLIGKVWERIRCALTHSHKEYREKIEVCCYTFKISLFYDVKQTARI